MLIMAATHQLVLMIGLFGVHYYERRRGCNPFAAKRWQAPAAAYAGLAVFVALLALLAKLQ